MFDQGAKEPAKRGSVMATVVYGVWNDDNLIQTQLEFPVSTEELRGGCSVEQLGRTTFSSHVSPCKAAAQSLPVLSPCWLGS